MVKNQSVYKNPQWNTSMIKARFNWLSLGAGPEPSQSCKILRDSMEYKDSFPYFAVVLYIVTFNTEERGKKTSDHRLKYEQKIGML